MCKKAATILAVIGFIACNSDRPTGECNNCALDQARASLLAGSSPCGRMFWVMTNNGTLALWYNGDYVIRNSDASWTFRYTPQADTSQHVVTSPVANGAIAIDNNTPQQYKTPNGFVPRHFFISANGMNYPLSSPGDYVKVITPGALFEVRSGGVVVGQFITAAITADGDNKVPGVGGSVRFILCSNEGGVPFDC